jgi:hypothetical protein
MKLGYMALFLIIAALFVAAPASAGTKYLGGDPIITVAISGTNEFSPGDEVTIPVVIQNSGLKDLKMIASDIVDRDDNPDTAKMVRVDLLENNAPVTVKSDPQMIGDIAAGSTTTVNFIVKIDKYAPAGQYDLLADLSYQYLNFAEQYGTDSIRYYYKTVDMEQDLPITIKPKVVIEVSNVETDSLNVGTEGYITMDVKNVGSDTGKNAVIKLESVDGSPVIPTDASVYESEFIPGEEKTVVFKASVSDDGEAKNYPVQVLVEYTDSEGETVTSDAVTVGVDVGGKVDFEVVSEPSILSPGEKGKIEIHYKNTGATSVYNAQARISAVDPFTSNDDTAYLGDIAPGETVTGIYEVTVDDEATLKTYGIDTEIRYRDALDNSQISDSMKAHVIIEKRSGMDILTNPLVLTLVVFIIAGAGYFVWSRKKKNNE